MVSTLVTSAILKIEVFWREIFLPEIAKKDATQGRFFFHSAWMSRIHFFGKVSLCKCGMWRAFSRLRACAPLTQRIASPILRCSFLPRNALPLHRHTGLFKAATALRPFATTEDTYVKLTQQQHVLLRPDAYIGSLEMTEVETWIPEDGKLVQRTVFYPPGLYKIFDEILANAADNKQRDPKMSFLHVDIDPNENSVQITNDGTGIPVKIHKKEKMYVAELIFGHLLTGSNFDDAEAKVGTH